MSLRRGTFRLALLVGQFAIKIPRASNLTSGLRCNQWEREMWRVWRRKFGWGNLCPIWFADPWGFVVIMPSVSRVTVEEILSADPDDYPDIDVEYKPENWGRLHGRVVCIDYGLSDAASVRERRKYLSKANRR